MMEVSKTLQADIRNIQNEIRITIQNHQLVVIKMRSDPLNLQMKKQLLGYQKHIILLGEKQKRLLQQLRKELEANSTNSTLAVKSVALSLGFNNYINNNNSNSALKCMPIRPSSVSSTSSSTTSEDSEDSQRERDEVVAKCCSNAGSDPSLATKLQFMSAVGLVTREVLSELQNKRVERKRRSTANHTQFVYGTSWDVSKRKKSSYLSSGVPVPLRRSLRVEPQTTTTTTENATETLRIPGLPASLTIERIKAQVCIVCRKSGTQLTVCSKCSADYHMSCSRICPQCPIDPKLEFKERAAERDQLLIRNTQLNSEKDELQKRATELSSALAAQDSNRKLLLQTEEATRRSIQRIQDFVTIIKSAPS